MQRQQSNNASTDKAMGSLLVNQLLVGNSKNIFVVILTSLLSVYVTQYTTRKINSFRKLMKENPLFLVWGMLNLLTGKPFFNDRKSIQDNNIQPEKKEEELIVDENEIDEDIYYIKLHQQRNRKDTALPLVSLNENLLELILIEFGKYWRNGCECCQCIYSSEEIHYSRRYSTTKHDDESTTSITRCGIF